MLTLRFGILFLAVLLCAGGALGATDWALAMAAAQAPAHDGDACGEEDDCNGGAPCSGAADGCQCACCPLPVLPGAVIPIESGASSQTVRLPVVRAHAPGTGSPLERPPQ